MRVLRRSDSLLKPGREPSRLVLLGRWMPIGQKGSRLNGPTVESRVSETQRATTLRMMSFWPQKQGRGLLRGPVPGYGFLVDSRRSGTSSPQHVFGSSSTGGPLTRTPLLLSPWSPLSGRWAGRTGGLYSFRSSPFFPSWSLGCSVWVAESAWQRLPVLAMAVTPGSPR